MQFSILNSVGVGGVHIRVIHKGFLAFHNYNLYSERFVRLFRITTESP